VQCGADGDGDNRPVASSVELHAQDEHARLTLTAPKDTVHCEVRFRGGVEIILPRVIPVVGNPSAGFKITTVGLKRNSLAVEADVNDSGQHPLRSRPNGN
jgi:hypothetical protein